MLSLLLVLDSHGLGLDSQGPGPGLGLDSQGPGPGLGLAGQSPFNMSSVCKALNCLLGVLRT